ncbi:MAG: class I SAM-dependent methyltransferase [Gammaproteobacteria bacterium]
MEPAVMETRQPLFVEEIARGGRFEFGRNWQKFLKHLNGKRIALAEQSLQKMLGSASLAGQTFLDVGCGSGLFSLAARRLGARVYSFDYDSQSVACARFLKDKFFPQDDQWIIGQGSVLDRAYLGSLGQHDVVYSWGVLHHTGAMWEALANVVPLVKPGGWLFIAIYNDQGWVSRYWNWVKRQSNAGPLRRWLLMLLHWPYFVGLRLLVRTLSGKGAPRRGMSLWYDMRDWLGGYPFEVAKPQEIVGFFACKGFIQQKVKTCGHRQGCNEYVFSRSG